MQKGDNPYTILDVPQNCDYLLLKKGYRKQALRHHPERKAGDAIKFAKVANAYELLCEPLSRHNYDLQQRYGTVKNPGYDPDAPDFFNFVSEDYDPSQPERMWNPNKTAATTGTAIEGRPQQPLGSDRAAEDVTEESWVTYTVLERGEEVTKKRSTKVVSSNPNITVPIPTPKEYSHVFQVDPLDLFQDEFPEGWKPHATMKKRSSIATTSSSHSGSKTKKKKSTTTTKAETTSKTKPKQATKANEPTSPKSESGGVTTKKKKKKASRSSTSKGKGDGKSDPKRLSRSLQSLSLDDSFSSIHPEDWLKKNLDASNRTNDKKKSSKNMKSTAQGKDTATASASSMALNSPIRGLELSSGSLNKSGSRKVEVSPGQLLGLSPGLLNMSGSRRIEYISPGRFSQRKKSQQSYRDGDDSDDNNDDDDGQEYGKRDEEKDDHNDGLSSASSSSLSSHNSSSGSHRSPIIAGRLVSYKPLADQKRRSISYNDDPDDDSDDDNHDNHKNTQEQPPPFMSPPKPAARYVYKNGKRVLLKPVGGDVASIPNSSVSTKSEKRIIFRNGKKIILPPDLDGA